MTHLANRTIRRLALASLGMLATIGVDTATAKTSFDGVWSVAIETKSGPCNGGYHYPIRISDGAVLDGGQGLISVSGHVRDNGALSVRMSRGAIKANGAGHLAGSSGSGSWHSPGCVGSWSAQKL
jgi:hypothetical protein